MKMNRKIMQRLLMVALVFALSIASVSFTPRGTTGVRAASSNPKISVDLQSTINSGMTNQVSVIIRTPTAPTSTLSSAVTGSGGAIKKKYKKIYALAVQLPPSAVANIAARTDVTYVALDRKMQVTGHLETTTGASLVRNYGTTSTGTIDGHGIGIAILDSGIVAAHHSFLGDPANYSSGSRVTYSIDFTGEGRTDDPYGHGTHVAGMAAAGPHVSTGAYTGVAPAANLIN